MLKFKKTLIVTPLILILLAAVGAGLWLGFDEQPESSLSQLEAPFSQAVRQQAGFGLYYPAQLPPGFSFNTNSVQVSPNYVLFSFQYDGGFVVITQQPKPAVMEKLSKTKEFKTASGQAFIADVNGKAVGFLLTDKTLVIISGIDKANADKLELLLRSFKPLD